MLVGLEARKAFSISGRLITASFLNPELFTANNLGDSKTAISYTHIRLMFGHMNSAYSTYMSKSA